MKKLLTLVVAVAMMVDTTNAAFTENKTEKKNYTVLSLQQSRRQQQNFS